MPSSRLLRVALVVLAASAVVGGLWYSGITFTGVAERVATLRGLGLWGMVLFMAVYAVGTWLMLPASWFQGAAGFLYGPLGIAMAWAGSIAFGAIAFLLARGHLRALIADRVGTGRLAALDQAMHERGCRLVVLLRLSPISPYNVVNYALGLTPVRLRHYLIGTAVGSLIPVLVWGAVGASLSDLAALTSNSASSGWPQYAVIGFTLVASGGIALFVKQALDRAAEPGEAAEALAG